MQNRCSLLALWIGALLLAQPGQAQKHPFQPLIDSPLSTYASPSGMALWADYDGDDDLDLLVAENLMPDRIFVNDGLGGFSIVDVNLSPAGELVSAAFADLDNDGDLDLPTTSLTRGTMYAGKGAGALVYVQSILEAYGSRDITVADLENDGDLDLFLARHDNQPNVLLRNTGIGFVPVEEGDVHGVANTSNSSCWSDYDNDGDSDLYVVNSEGDASILYRNDAGVLISVPDPVITSNTAAASSCVWVDFDRDCDFDLFVTYPNGVANQLFEYEEGSFTLRDESALASTDDAFNQAWGDIDNDGDEDLIVVRRYEPTAIFLNDGDGGFEEILLDRQYTQTVWAFNAGLADYDEDGDLDLFIPTGDTAFEFNRLYANTTDASANWLQIRLHGIESNRFGIGARVEAHATIQGVPTKQVREMRTHIGRRTQGGLRVHFGLADASVVDSLIISWPSGIRQVVENPGINAIVEIVEPMPTSVAPGGPASPITALGVYPNPARHRVAIEIQNAGTGLVTMELFDVRGRRVWWFVQVAEAGELVRRTWPEGSRDVSPGIYTLRVHSGGDVVSRRLTILR